MNYLTYLKNKNLSEITINIYIRNINIFKKFLKSKEMNKSNFVSFIKIKNKELSANSIRLLYSSILSYLKYKKKWNMYNEFKDIKLPKVVLYNRTIISIEEFNNIKETIKLNSWYEKRNWIIFSFLFLTGIRAFEINQIRKNLIYENKIKIIGKSKKERYIFICDYLHNILNNWEFDYININKNNKQLTHKQLNIIIKKIGIIYFNKNISCHSLRRSFATNLLRKNIDIKTVSIFMGHSNINTTSRYLYLSTDEMINKIKSIF